MAKSLEERLQVLEDVNEIIKLKAHYLNAADGGWDRLSHDAETITPLFVPGGSWECETMGHGHGHEDLRKMYLGFRETLPFSYHMVMNPIVEVTGDEATGDWHLLWLGTDSTGQRLWSAARYTDELVRTTEGWRFKKMSVKTVFIGPYDESWEKLMCRGSGI